MNRITNSALNYLKLTKKQLIIIALLTILATTIYIFSLHTLKQDFDFFFIGILLIVCLLYAWFYRNKEPYFLQFEKNSTAIILSIYTILYLGSIYIINILGSSVSLWLVQFTIPLFLLRFLKQPLSGINFQWKLIFNDFKYVLASSAILVPFLIFNVRDTEQIIQLFHSWKIAIYFPLSILYMLFIVAFWEEFFFRGIVLSSVLKLTNNVAVSIFISAFLFAIYHLPMRFLNIKSLYYGDLSMSFSATISEQFLMGLFLGIIAYKSKNIWHVVWLHAILNGVSFMFQLSTMLKF